MISSNLQLPIPLLPPKHVDSHFFTWLVKMMDEYRDIRLIWTVAEAALMLLIAGLVIYFIYRMWRVETHLKEKFERLDVRLKKIAAIHEQIDELNAEAKEKNHK